MIEYPGAFDAKVSKHYFTSSFSPYWHQMWQRPFTGGEEVGALWDGSEWIEVRRLIESYGCFFLAHLTRFIEERLRREGATTGWPASHDYIMNRIIEDPDLMRIWIDHYEAHKTASYNCELCGCFQWLLRIHPKVIEVLGVPPNLCYNCFGLSQRDARARFLEHEDLFRRQLVMAPEDRACEFCKRAYIFPEQGKNSLILLYINNHISVCHLCLLRLNRRKLAADDMLARLRSLAEISGKVPPRDHLGLCFLIDDEARMREFFKVYLDTPDAAEYKDQFGSYFAALVQAGLIPSGARRTVYGTQVLAVDGHLCFSMEEKLIDDWLYSRGIPHTKEPKYPGSELRADWEVEVDGTRVFIEYFGLMSFEPYRRKVDEKRKIAAAAGIRVVELMPGEPWERKLQRELRLEQKED